MNQNLHQPVLLREIADALDPKPGESYLDETAGYGGHAKAIAKLLGGKGKITLVDRDSQAIAYLDKLFGLDKRVRIVNSDFLSASRELQAKGEKFDLILADLGVSSLQIDDPSRGFSYQRSGPLDMRMDRRQKLSAKEIVNGYKQTELEDILVRFGELRRSQASSVAISIIGKRPINSTIELKEAVKSAIRGSKKLIEAQVFQALRISVNRELELLEGALPVWAGLLKSGGRLAVISFHSLEDRIVKQFFVQRSKNRYEADLSVKNKKPINSSQNEIVHNPRARSAKLRVAVKK
jgi:16S rRNA (cytosine1402-N4)-methyltransferase